MRRLTANLVGFHENPESSARIIVPSQRGDEIGVAERELSDMQRDLVSMLHQKSRLAALGLAVSKINHDLRNLLASSQLLSDQLASVPDPRVQRFAPKLMRSLERAIAFCQSTLSYGRAQEAAPDRRMILVEPVVAEVRESAGLAADASIAWISAIERGLSIDADPDQLFRVLLNLVRNAAQALESRPKGDAAALQIRITGRREGSVAIIEVSDTGPGVPARAREHLFEAFQTSGRPGGSGLGLAIAAELVRAHGGDIHLVEGTIGATFRISIPGPPGGTAKRPQRAGAGVSRFARHSGAIAKRSNPESRCICTRFHSRRRAARNDWIDCQIRREPAFRTLPIGPERVAKALFRDVSEPFSDASGPLSPNVPSEKRARSSAG